MRPEIREARSADIPDVLRMVKLLWGDMELPVTSGEWEHNAATFFESSWQSDSVRVYVAEHRSRSVACGVGTILQSLPTFWIPNGKMGYVQWFYTEPEFRRQGIAGEILDNVIVWFRQQGVKRGQLIMMEP